MCPPLSCCHGRSPSPLSGPLYALLRLQLALATEPERLALYLPCALHARQHALWQQAQQAVQVHYGAVCPRRARELLERLLTSLLLEGCCQQSLCRHVPLREALGQEMAG